MKRVVFLLILLACFSYSCEQEFSPGEPVLKRELSHFTIDELPEVQLALQEKLQLTGRGDHFGVPDLFEESDFQIRWDQVLEAKDERGNVNYTFSIDDNDGNPFVFYNLVIGKTPHGDFKTPMLLKFDLHEDYIPEYIRTGRMEKFKGEITSTFLNNWQRGGREYEANLGGSYSKTETSAGCPDVETVDNSNPSSGGTSTGGTNGDDGCGWVVTDEVYRWKVCDDYGCEYHSEVISSTVSFECEGSESQESADASDCPKDDSEIALLDPFAMRKAMEDAIDEITDPEEKRKAQLQYLRTHGGEEGKALAAMIEAMISAPGITYSDGYEINALANSLYLNLRGQYYMAIFSVNNMSLILSFGISGVLSNTAQSTFYRAFARYAGSTQGYATFSAFKTAHGVAGTGKAWHHIVSQRASNITRFGANRIHNTANLVKLPHGAGSWHQRITNFYNTINPRGIDTQGLRFGEWVAQKSFQQQFEWGLRVIEWMKL